MDYLKILDQLTPDSTGDVLNQISDTYLVARHRVAASDEVDAIHRASQLSTGASAPRAALTLSGLKTISVAPYV